MWHWRRWSCWLEQYSRMFYRSQLHRRYECNNWRWIVVSYYINQSTFWSKHGISASEKGTLNETEFLLTQGASVAPQTREGLASLDAACQGNYSEVMCWLVCQHPLLVGGLDGITTCEDYIERNTAVNHRRDLAVSLHCVLEALNLQSPLQLELSTFTFDL